MTTTERIFANATINERYKTVEVLWYDVEYESGVEIGRTAHRRAYSAMDKDVFLAEIPGAQTYIDAVGGWNDPIVPSPTPQEAKAAKLVSIQEKNKEAQRLERLEAASALLETMDDGPQKEVLSAIINELKGE